MALRIEVIRTNAWGGTHVRELSVEDNEAVVITDNNGLQWLLRESPPDWFEGPFYFEYVHPDVPDASWMPES